MTPHLRFQRESRQSAPQSRLDESAAEYAAALQSQIAVIQGRRFRILSYGPPHATGWPRTPNLFYRCLNCGYIMHAAADTYDTCFCNSMSRDPGAGRFGSTHGDQAIETLESLA